VGYPSVGKSTIISVISNAKPKIAEYHFTTITPNLGVAKVDDRELVFIDVPGLIEGAHEGKGLGLQFLRHIERARVVLHVIDAGSLTPTEDLRVIRQELQQYSKALSEKPWVLVVNKSDLLSESDKQIMMEYFEEEYNESPVFISAATGDGLTDMLREVAKEVPEEIIEEVENPEEDTDEVLVMRPAEQKEDKRQVVILQEKDSWRLHNKRLEQMARMTPEANEDAAQRVYDVLQKWRVPEKIHARGAIAGDKILIGEKHWIYRGL